MKIGIFDPYLDTLGGGERYILTVASCLAKQHDVFIFWDIQNASKFREKVKEKLGIDVSSVKFTKNIFSRDTHLLIRSLVMRNYDWVFFVSDGSFPFFLSKKNILIFQFPVNWVGGTNLLTRLKLRKIAKIICYSDYVKKFLDKTFLVDSLVLAPSVTQVPSGRLKKENMILSVGRFTKAINTKKQEVLVEVFKEMCKKGLLRWKLVLIGSVLAGDEYFVKSIGDKIKGYNIEILTNSSFNELREYYKKAKIYWHAAGFGEDLKKHPERAEHFGISTVEAMSAGAVPVVINAGGQPEIVRDEQNGFLWETLGELQEKTLRLMRDQNLWEKLSEEAKQRAKFFSSRRFCEELEKIIK